MCSCEYPRYCSACAGRLPAARSCGCGAAATTEVQVGWDADLNGGAGGGQYEVVCDRCYDEAVAAAPPSYGDR